MGGPIAVHLAAAGHRFAAFDEFGLPVAESGGYGAGP